MSDHNSEQGQATYTQSLSAAANTITSTATSVYQQAPDLGITSTAQAVLNKVTGTAPSLVGSGHTSSSEPEQTPASDEAEEELDGPAKLKKRHEQSLQQSKEAGPSSQARVGKSQTEVGIEDNIPTSAGAGTTLPQDSTVQSNCDKNVKRHDANVPADYLNLPSPSSHGGGGGEVESDARTSHNSSTQTDAQGGTEGALPSSDQGVEKRSLGQKIKEGIKGEAKVISGKIRRDPSRVEEGKNIKHGHT